MRTVVVYSGGLDSTVLLAKLLREGRELVALSFDYGQRHRRELDSAQCITKHFSVPHRVIDLRAAQSLFAGSALTSDNIAVPHGHYEDDSMQQTVVPNRNMIFLSFALAGAIQFEAASVAYGAHAGDHAIYPDCRPEFVNAVREVAKLCHYDPIALETPFVTLRKEEIVRLGHELDIPFELTWSCYEGGAVHCGKCGTCVERKEAFALAHVKDPTEYLRG